MPIKINKSVFIWTFLNYIINVYLAIMSNNFGYLDIILLAMIAGFIILRLRNILGRKTGHQDKVYSSICRQEIWSVQKFRKK